ncbi:hypothetical protein ACWT_5658 [Actinoplanes sp. SE50]|nr:hypothetical protein ACPL_5788 [Actinoplanes sp. SE50/110]ATO85073.1 hypothetical protein ACWT_5658 [Actinoplanes sp. SE50]SLM02484.1 hypothetical protein ACSP50_5734 [Actinoplanes sp. SE50/110]
MTQGILRTRHGSDLSPQSLPHAKISTYAGVVPDNLRRFRMDEETWKEYGKLVGDAGRSADLKAYIEWRLDNPDTPLPGKRRGPVKKTRPAKPEADA